MMTFAFYLFATLVVVAGFMVVISKNPVHSVLWLIAAFFSASGLFVLLGAELLAMLLMIVYVGAVAVLFLFVVMMLDIDFAALKGELARYMPLGLLIGAVMILQLAIAFKGFAPAEGAAGLRAAVMPEGMHNTQALGMLIYDRYVYLFMAAALILLVAMIGAILLTLRHRKDIKRQNVVAQMHRDPAKAMDLIDIKPGQGL